MPHCRFAVPCALAVSFATGCARMEGSGMPSAEVRTFESVAALVVSGSAHVHVAIDPALDQSTRVDLFGDAEVFGAIETELVDGELVIAKKAALRSEVPLAIRIDSGSLIRVDLTGSGRIDLSSFAAAALELGLDGSGEILATGVTETLTVTRSGSGSVMAGTLQASGVDVASHGSGHTEVCANDIVKGERSGSGDLIVRCEPASVIVEELGSDGEHSGEVVLIP